MKILSIRISNSLSFALRTRLEPDITFRTAGNRGSYHVLIGPNGAGKSNFIEVINYCFHKALFRPAQLNQSLAMAAQRDTYFNKEQLRQAVQIPNTPTDWNLRSHDGSGSDVQQIQLALDLNDNDFRNMEFLLDNAQTINDILDVYSSLGRLVPQIAPPNLRLHSQVNVIVEYQQAANQVSITFAAEDDPAVGFIKTYLRNFPVFQMAITLYNRYVRIASESRWPELQQTFAMIGSYRNYSSVNNAINVESNRSFQPVFDRLRTDSTRRGGGDEPAVFDMVKRKIGYAFYDQYEQGSLTYALNKLYSEEPLVSINNLLMRYLNLKIRVRKMNNIDSGMEMHFERSGTKIDTADLSSGEKGILHFIFTLYGFDLKNGVVVIDEPELHLHPQIQREYQAIINDVRGKLDIQFIIATHSPIFVGPDNIEDVYRFHKPDSCTEVVNPQITAPQKYLTKILDLTNSAKIFFVNKAILVEGETDEYFLKFFLDYLKAHATDSTAPPWQSRISDFEIFNIKGKGARQTWTNFLSAFGLEVSFVGDWDSISEVTDFNFTKYTTQYQQSLSRGGSTITTKGSNDGAALLTLVDKVLIDPSPKSLKDLSDLKTHIAARATNYSALIEYIKTTDPSEWNRIETAINDSKHHKVYVLRHGELEDYLGLSGKGIDGVIDFCENRFLSWLSNPTYGVYREDLVAVLESTFS